MGDIPEQVFIDAAQAFGITANYSVAGTPEMAGHPPFRAAVASAYRAGQAATPDGPRTWALPDGTEATARIVAVVNWRRGSVHGMTADNAEAQRWCREIIDRYGDNLAASQVVGLVKVGPGSLFVDAPTDATPAADRQDGDDRDG